MDLLHDHVHHIISLAEMVMEGNGHPVPNAEKEIVFAEKVVREIDDKKAKGIGVFTVDGKMIDIAFYDGAKRTLAMAKAAGVYKGEL